MPVLTVTNLTSSKVPIGRFVGTIAPSSSKVVEITANELEMSKDQLVALAAAGHISWDTSSTPDTADNKAEVVLGGSMILQGVGDPDTVVSAPIGTAFLRTDGGLGTTLYVKELGTGNTGWTAK